MKKDEKELIRRYLVWCYKTTKEELDRIDRKFTQLKVDQVILSKLLKNKFPAVHSAAYQKKVSDFKSYMQRKEAEALGQKFLSADNRDLHPDYEYLNERLKAVEAAVRQLLGTESLLKIKRLYEGEMTRRILAAKDH